MARLNVNPTRMQLKTLSHRLSIARHGHKLLKDKCDELIRRYTKLIKDNYHTRLDVENEVKALLNDFCFAKGYMSSKQVLNNLIFPYSSYTCKFNEKSVMNVFTPNIEVKTVEGGDLPYSYIDTNVMFDSLIFKVNELMPKIINLANIEKTCQILSREIERIKRRVNALEFVMIPDLEETIKFISMKIEENDRASRIRLIKVKSMIEQRNS